MTVASYAHTGPSPSGSGIPYLLLAALIALVLVTLVILS